MAHLRGAQKAWRSAERCSLPLVRVGCPAVGTWGARRALVFAEPAVGKALIVLLHLPVAKPPEQPGE